MDIPIYKITKRDNGKGLKGRLDFNEGVLGIVEALREENYDAHYIIGYVLVSPPLTDEHKQIIQHANYDISEISEQIFSAEMEASNRRREKRALEAKRRLRRPGTW